MTLRERERLEKLAAMLRENRETAAEAREEEFRKRLHWSVKPGSGRKDKWD